jgi:hypothetical protein
MGGGEEGDGGGRRRKQREGEEEKEEANGVSVMITLLAQAAVGSQLHCADHRQRQTMQNQRSQGRGDMKESTMVATEVAVHVQ